MTGEPRYDFSGRVALVTGAASGMGLATARAFAAAGAAVVLADRDENAAAGAAAELITAGRTALAVGCDVADEGQVEALVRRTVEAFGRLDMAFNNAGIVVPPTDAADELADQFDRVQTVNRRGVWSCMKHELRVMREQGIAATPAGRLGTAEGIAAAVLWLCSPAASFVDGIALPVDGGYTAQ